MPNNQKTEIIEVWTTLKDKITALLSDLDSFKSNQEVIMERYEKKIKEKNKEMTKLEEEFKDLSGLVAKVRKEVATGSANVSRQLILDILNRR